MRRNWFSQKTASRRIEDGPLTQKETTGGNEMRSLSVDRKIFSQRKYLRGWDEKINPLNMQRRKPFYGCLRLGGSAHLRRLNLFTVWCCTKRVLRKKNDFLQWCASPLGYWPVIFEGPECEWLGPTWPKLHSVTPSALFLHAFAQEG